jgi:hypothetical protein
MPIEPNRETREEGPLLTVETEANKDSQDKGKGSFLGWFVGLVVGPSLLLSAQYKILFSSPYTISIFVPSLHSNLGRQSRRAAYLSGAELRTIWG